MSSSSHRPRASSRSSKGNGSRASDTTRPPFHNSSNLHIDADAPALSPCAATASFFLFAQGREIVCVHHDTLQVERRFQRHKEDVRVIAADNVSDRGSGRQVVSYDAGLEAVVWDLYTGDEISRFSSYEKIQVAAFMKDGTIAFGNDQGSIILFEPTTSEHISARTIFDPVTALAPSTDLCTFAIGYKNGSILIANIKPQFHVLHTLNNSSRGPSPVTGLAWHGSSSRQKSDMLATQTAEGDLRVWSVPKSPNSNELPRSIRSLNNELSIANGRTWIAWSKMGRIIQHVDSETRSWDVRTKQTVQTVVPTISPITGIANCGPTATLFTVGPNYMIQQYDLNPEENQMTMVANVHHPPTLPPPTPPDSLHDNRSGLPTPDLVSSNADTRTPSPPQAPPSIDVESSEEEGGAMSPLQKIAQEMDAIEEERRDQVTPLSPVSSRASMSSRSSYRSRPRTGGGRRRDRGAATPESEATDFSLDSPAASHADSASIRSLSSAGSAGAFSKYRHRASSREKSVESSARLDLFPQTRHRLREVKFRSPKRPVGGMSPDMLRREMLSVIFGWEGDIEALIRDEYMRHRKGSEGAVLLGKWLGELGADALANAIGSESMSSSDWMLLALSTQMGGGDNGKRVGEAFVKKLLEQNDVHRAVAIMLGLGNMAAAVDQYSSNSYDMEAILLCCLTMPQNWPKILSLIRKWGETAAQKGQPELAVRCYACVGMEYSDSLVSSPTSSASNPTQTQSPMTSPTSPPSATTPSRLTAKNASLKLITNFGDRGRLQSQKLGETPIAESALSQALSPGGGNFRSRSKGTNREPSTARTATPGGWLAHKRAPSSQRSDVEGTPKMPKAMSAAGSEKGIPTPQTAALLSKPGEAFAEHRRNVASIDQATSDLYLNLENSKPRSRAASRNNHRSRSRPRKDRESDVGSSRAQQLEPPDTATTASEQLSPLMTDGSVRSYRARRIDKYIESLEQTAPAEWQIDRPPTRGEESSRVSTRRSERSRSRARQSNVSTNVSERQEIPPSKRSPSSPVPMNPAETFREYDDERYYGVTSPIEDPAEQQRRQQQHLSTGSKSSNEVPPPSRDGARSASRSGRETIGDRARARSSSRKPESRRGTGSRAASPERGAARSTSRRPVANRSYSENDFGNNELLSPASSRAGHFSSRESAQKELEERRLSLARRPSVPTIPLPGQFDGRPSPTSAGSTFLITEDPEFRSQTVDPSEMMRYTAKGLGVGISTTSVPIGLPSTPRAMKHTSSNSHAGHTFLDTIPAVPALPDNVETLLPVAFGQNPADASQLLPSTVYQAAQRRSSSAPPEKAFSRPRRSSVNSTRGGAPHSRKASQLPSSAQPNDRASDHDILVLEEDETEDAYAPPVLPELQHLNNPPPPPPPPPPQHALPRLNTALPSASGVINIAIDGTNTTNARQPTPSNTALAASTSPSHRRGTSGNTDTFGSKWRSMTERIRSTSKGRPRTDSRNENAAVSPANRSPYETLLSSQAYFPPANVLSGPPPRGESAGPAGEERKATPATSYGYRNPKEIRAAMGDVGGFI